MVNHWSVKGTEHRYSQLLFYGDLPVEAQPQNESDPDKTWPSKGEITFDDVKLKYRPELPPVLKSVSFHISPGEKVTPSTSFCEQLG